ncbi:MAG: OadG family protein [Bacteroidales bacterium]|nr:OadG family protein [Bacteroidales bacterium]
MMSTAKKRLLAIVPALACPAVLSAGSSAKSDYMAATDPYGLIMTLTAVLVVFSALILLHLFFGELGKWFTGKYHLPSCRRRKTDSGTAAAGTALREETAEDEEAVCAAISAALEEYSGETAHDNESYLLTIRPGLASTWNGRGLFRKAPDKKTAK